jgi:very-short-patch-repair endonuclease
MPKIATPKPESPGEAAFLLHCRAYKFSPEREYRFCEGRRWRFDFAFPEQMIAIEIEGGIWSRGRHTRPQGYEKDLEKYNMATRLGWSVYRFTTDMVMRGEAIDLLLSCIWQEDL